MTENQMDGITAQSPPRSVRRLIILVAITAVLSLLYGIQYHLGSPVHLAVISEINDLDLNPDYTLAAVGTKDGSIHVWEVPEKINTALEADFDVSKEAPWTRHTLTGHSTSIIEVEFVSDGATLLSVSDDGQVRLWDTTSAFTGAGIPSQVKAELSVERAPLIDAAFAADGSKLAAVDSGGKVGVWDLETGRILQSFEPAEGATLAIALSSDGSLVAAGNGVKTRVWSVDTGNLFQTLEGYWEKPEEQEGWLGHTKDVTALAISNDNTLLASGSADTTILFWDLETGEIAAPSEGHWATVTVMVFGNDGTTLLSGGRDNKTRNLRLPGGRSTAIYEGHLNTINGVAFGPQPDTLFTASADGTLRIWETANQKIAHTEWSRFGFQPVWGRTMANWMLISGILGLVCLWGLTRFRMWGHLFALALYLLGPVVVLGLPLFEVMSYPIFIGIKLQIAWPIVLLAAWYVFLLLTLMREQVALFYEAPQLAPLSEQLVASNKTLKTRFGIFSLAIWLALLVILFSLLRRFNLDLAFMGHYLEFIMAGSGLTVIVSAASIVLAIVLALLGALGRLSKSPIANGISSFYISLIRGTPLLVQIFIWYLGLPRLGIILEPLPAGILALGVNYGAYMTEIFRAGIQAIGQGQYEAASALGMSRGQTFRRIVLPQAFRIVIPPIGNEFIAMMKDSSLVSIMSIWELTYRAQKIGRQNFRNLETFLIAAAFYWILTVIFQFLQGKLEEYMARGERR